MVGPRVRSAKPVTPSDTYLPSQLGLSEVEGAPSGNVHRTRSVAVTREGRAAGVLEGSMASLISTMLRPRTANTALPRAAAVAPPSGPCGVLNRISSPVAVTYPIRPPLARDEVNRITDSSASQEYSWK